MIKNSLGSTQKKIKKRSIKNRNQKLDILLQQMFNFQYAGKANIFIHTRYDNFELVIQGVHIVENIYCFAPNFVKRYKFESLYTAIKAFNIVVSIVASSMDWFTPEVFKGSAIYDEIFFQG